MQRTKWRRDESFFKPTEVWIRFNHSGKSSLKSDFYPKILCHHHSQNSQHPENATAVSAIIPKNSIAISSEHLIGYRTVAHAKITYQDINQLLGNYSHIEEHIRRAYLQIYDLRISTFLNHGEHILLMKLILPNQASLFDCQQTNRNNNAFQTLLILHSFCTNRIGQQM